MSKRTGWAELMQEARDEIDGKRLGDAFTSAFIGERTRFASREQLAAAMQTYGSPDAFARAETPFGSWLEFLHAAWTRDGKETLAKQLP